MSLIRGVQLREATGSYATTGSNVFIGNQSITGSIRISGSVVFPSNFGGIYTTTTTGTEVQSFYIDQGNNLVHKATSGGDQYFLEGSNVVARFVNGGTINLGGTSATNNPTVRIPAAGGMIVTGSVYISGSLYVDSNKQFNYGAFYDTATQTGIQNVSQSFQFRSSSYSSGVSIINDSRISVSHNGVYNIQFSAQIVHNGNQTEDIWIWLKKNGSNIPNSATLIRATRQLYTVAAWNFVEQINTTDYVEIAWQAGHNDMRIVAEPTSGNIPGIPSLILTVTQVA